MNLHIEQDTENVGQTSKELEEGMALAGLLDKPVSLIREGGKYGLKSFASYMGLFVLCAFTNTFLYVWAVLRVILSDAEWNGTAILLLNLAIGLGVTIFTGYKLYQTLILDGFRLAYSKFGSVFKKLCAAVVDKAEPLFKKQQDEGATAFARALDFDAMLKEYFPVIPGFLRKVIVFVLRRTPITQMITDLKDDILSGSKESASLKLYARLNDYITNEVLDTNTRWFWWLLAADIALQLIIMYN